MAIELSIGSIVLTVALARCAWVGTGKLLEVVEWLVDRYVFKGRLGG